MDNLETLLACREKRRSAKISRDEGDQRKDTDMEHGLDWLVGTTSCQRNEEKLDCTRRS